MEKGKLVIIHPMFNIYGGAERVMYDLFNRASKDANVEMYSLFNNGDAKQMKNLFYATKEVPQMANIFGYKVNPFNKKYVLRLARILAKRSTKEDKFVFTNFPGSWIIYEMIKIKPELKKAEIYFLSFEPDRILWYDDYVKYDFMPEDIKSNKLWLFSRFCAKWRQIDRYVVRKIVRKTFTLSEYVAMQTRKVFDLSENLCKKELEMYVDLSKFKVGDKLKSRQILNEKMKVGNKSLNLGKNDFVILSLSRLEKSKGINELYNVSKSILKNPKYKNVKILIGGKGELYDEMLEKTKNNPNIFVLGFVPDELLDVLYSASNLFTFFGRKETGGPLTVLEGMYANNLILASNEAGPPELVENIKSGFLVSPDDSKEIKRLIMKMHYMFYNDKKKWDAMTKYSSKRVKDKFGFENCYSGFKRAVGF